MSIASEIKIQLKENNAAVLKKLGQNFLVSRAVLAKIIAAADLKPQDTILEIGPGLGALTFELAKKAKQIIAVEKDRKISAILEKNFAEKDVSNVKVINQDIFNFQFSKLVPPHSSAPSRGVGRKCYKLVANLPYNIATAVIMKFLEAEKPPTLIVVMVQKEVAQRICAKPPHMNKLAIFCQLYAEPKIMSYVPPSAFWPKPKVDSAILRLQPIKTFRALGSADSFAKIVNAGFSHPRKTLLNNLVGGLPSPNSKEGCPPQISKERISQWLLQNNINPMQRPETLSVEDWKNLAKTSAKVLIHS